MRKNPFFEIGGQVVSAVVTRHSQRSLCEVIGSKGEKFADVGKLVCSKCGGSPCGVDDEGKFMCLGKPQAEQLCLNNDCKPGQVCVPEPKQCITTPCPQYRCEVPSTNNVRDTLPAPRDGIDRREAVAGKARRALGKAVRDHGAIVIGAEIIGEDVEDMVLLLPRKIADPRGARPAHH